MAKEHMVQKQFAENVIAIAKIDPKVPGLAVGGSWVSNELDEFSDPFLKQ